VGWSIKRGFTVSSSSGHSSTVLTVDRRMTDIASSMFE
jgi:hypothetical protein